jgi:hypothetical protein
MMIACGPGRKIAREPNDQWQRPAVGYGISGDLAEFKREDGRQGGIILFRNPSSSYSEALIIELSGVSP